jgi:aminoglycoside 3-N-acetyltransferase
MAPMHNLPLSLLLAEAYKALPIADADILYIYTDFRFFGTYISDYKSRNDFCNAFIDPLLAMDKTVILTTFTYTSEGIFDVIKTPTRLGAMNKWILGREGVRRSEHPLFSYAAIGPQANLVEKIGKSAFGFDSIFDRLRQKRAAFLHIGRPVSLGNTVLHYVEHTCGATYRAHKAFQTEVFRGDQYIGTDYSAFLRRRDIPNESFEFDFSRAAEKLYNKGLVQQVGSDDNLSNISFYWYDPALDYLRDLFYEDQRIFIKSDYIGY